MSPAKTMNESCISSENESNLNSHHFNNYTNKIAQEIRKLNKSELKTILGEINSKLTDINYDRYKNFKMFGENSENRIPTEEKQTECYSAPAGFLYDGPAFKGLDCSSLTVDEMVFARSHLKILSALYGALNLDDNSQRYRLEMNSKLKIENDKHKFVPVVEFLKEPVTKFLSEALLSQNSIFYHPSSSSSKFLINLASEEYFKVIDKKLLEQNEIKVITCVFKDNGRVLSAFVKRARGLMARFILKNIKTETEKKDKSDLLSFLKSFNYDNYSCCEKECGDDIVVFNRLKATSGTR
jgi:cytoplasmic iron level regulating protein YaaA (DUF328/UPF0246 family)